MQKPAVHNKQQYTNHITSIKISRFVVGLLQYLCNTHTMKCHIILPTTIPTSWSPCLVLYNPQFSDKQIYYMIHNTISTTLSTPATLWIGIPTTISTHIILTFNFWKTYIDLRHLVLSTIWYCCIPITLHPLSLRCIPSSHPIIYPHWFCPLYQPPSSISAFRI